MWYLLKRFTSRYIRVATAIAVLAKLFEVVFDLLTPIIVARMIDDAIKPQDMDLALKLSGLLIIFALVGFSFVLLCQIMASRISQTIGTNLRQEIFTRALHAPTESVAHLGADTLLTRLTNDINQIQVGVALSIRQLVRWPLLALGSVISALLLRPELGMVFVVALPIILISFTLTTKTSIPRFVKLQETLDALFCHTREGIQGTLSIRAASREASRHARFSTLAQVNRVQATQLSAISSLLNPITIATMNLAIVWILHAASIQVEAGTLTQGETIAFVNYLTQAAISIVYVANLLVTYNRAEASAQRIKAVLHDLPSTQDSSTTQLSDDELTRLKHAAISAQDLSYSYPDAPQAAVSDINFELKAGESLGIIGATGSGKSTLLKLIAGLLKPTGGSIRIQSHELSSLDDKARSQLFAYVPQKASLMAASLAENLRWGNSNAQDQELMSAIDAAQARIILDEKNEGLEMHVASGGSNFSGGQRQRLSIARALVANTPWILLDDATSALDLATEARLRKALSALAERSTIVVSQRVRTLSHCDKILVLDHGKQVALGTHEDLLQNSKIYQEICASQDVLEAHHG